MMEVTRPREVDVAEQDSQTRLDVRTSSSSPKFGGTEVLRSSLCSAPDAEHGQEEEGDWNVNTRGRHDFCELDHINHENSPSFDSPAHLLGSSVHGLESPNTLSRQHESCITPVLHETSRLHVSEETIANVLDATSPEVDNANDETSPDVSNEEKSTSAAHDADASKKRKLCLSTNGHEQSEIVVKKARKKPVNVWAKSSSRKGGKRSSKNGSQSNAKNGTHENLVKEDCVYLTPASKHQDKIEDGPDMPVVLSKFHKAEKIELSDDRLSASNTKGYRMVRATRGVTDGAWYFEILVEKLGQSGHTRLGWSTQKGEIQAPVGFDNYSYAYRDVDGSKVHMAVRERYGEPYVEGDVIGFYINLPNGAELAPKPASLVSYKGQPYILDEKEDPPKIVPGSEIAFFRNGIFQGTAFKDLSAGRYFPAASMYTLPDEPRCIVKFHFGPDFRFPPKDIGERPIPQPIACASHCGMATLGFGSMDWKSESSGMNSTHTLEPQKTGEGS